MRHAPWLSGIAALAATCAGAAADARWCLSMSGLGPLRAGMTVEQVLPLADWSGLERARPARGCWYLRYEGGGADFRLMIIDGRVARLELYGASTLRTLGGARIGMSEADLERLYGARLDVQPHKYEPQGHTITVRSGAGDHGLRFETAQGKVTAIQAGPWSDLHYVEGCS
jgi:hypothetical protein